MNIPPPWMTQGSVGQNPLQNTVSNTNNGHPPTTPLARLMFSEDPSPTTGPQPNAPLLSNNPFNFSVSVNQVQDDSPMVGSQDDMQTERPTLPSSQPASERMDDGAGEQTLPIALTSDEIAQALQDAEDKKRLELRKQQDEDDLSYALALQLQQEDEMAIARQRQSNPLTSNSIVRRQAFSEDLIDINVCVDWKVRNSNTGPDQPSQAQGTGAAPRVVVPSRRRKSTGSSADNRGLNKGGTKSLSSSPNTKLEGQPGFERPKGLLEMEYYGGGEKGVDDVGPRAPTPPFGGDNPLLSAYPASFRLKPQTKNEDIDVDQDEDEDIELDEEEEFEQMDPLDDVRTVQVASDITVAQLMIEIVRSNTFPIRKVAHIKYISLSQPDTAGKLRHPTPVPVGPGGFNLNALPMPGFMPSAMDTTTSNSMALSNSTSSAGDEGYVVLQNRQRLCDLHLTPDSVFKVTLRKKDRERKRKRRFMVEEDSANVQELKKHNEQLQSQLQAITSKYANLQQDIILDQLPQLTLNQSDEVLITKRHKPEEQEAKQMEDERVVTPLLNPAAFPNFALTPASFSLPSASAPNPGIGSPPK